MLVQVLPQVQLDTVALERLEPLEAMVLRVLAQELLELVLEVV